MKEFVCDLHIHTCLSPCAGLEMSPRAIVAACLEKNIDIIAVTDHNASENIASLRECAFGSHLTVLAGMEMTTVEEIHIVAVVEDWTSMTSLQKKIYDNLPGKNNEDLFGVQAIVNSLDEVEGFNERLLIGATRLSLEESLEAIKDLEGLAIASHIDREAFSLISQLGFVAPTMAFDALELARLTREEARNTISGCNYFPLVYSSDAHRLCDIGRRTTKLRLEKATFAEIKMALCGKERRCIVE